MKIKDWLKGTQTQLTDAKVESARLDSLLILSMVLGKPKEWILANTDELIPRSKGRELDALVNQRAKHFPMAYMLGYREFYGHEFIVNQDVLIPRPETEELVDYIIKNAPQNAAILDVGTGSGCIAVSIKLARPDIEVTATDISKKALKVAKLNAKALKTVINFVHSDLFSKFDILDSKFSIITANLPYVPTDSSHATNAEIDFEPKEALFSGYDGLDHYRKFFEQANNFLSPNGFIIIEHDPEQYSRLETIGQTTKVTRFVTKLKLKTN